MGDETNLRLALFAMEERRGQRCRGQSEGYWWNWRGSASKTRGTSTKPYLVAIDDSHTIRQQELVYGRSRWAAGRDEQKTPYIAHRENIPSEFVRHLGRSYCCWAGWLGLLTGSGRGCNSGGRCAVCTLGRGRQRRAGFNVRDVSSGRKRFSGMTAVTIKDGQVGGWQVLIWPGLVGTDLQARTEMESQVGSCRPSNQILLSSESPWPFGLSRLGDGNPLPWSHCTWPAPGASPTPAAGNLGNRNCNMVVFNRGLSTTDHGHVGQQTAFTATSSQWRWLLLHCGFHLRLYLESVVFCVPAALPPLVTPAAVEHITYISRHRSTRDSWTAEAGKIHQHGSSRTGVPGIDVLVRDGMDVMNGLVKVSQSVRKRDTGVKQVARDFRCRRLAFQKVPIGCQMPEWLLKSLKLISRH